MVEEANKLPRKEEVKINESTGQVVDFSEKREWLGEKEPINPSSGIRSIDRTKIRWLKASDEIVSGTDILVWAADGRYGFTNTSYDKFKEIVVVHWGTYKVTMSIIDGWDVGKVFGRIYVNDTAVGTEREVEAAGSYQDFSEDITVEAGDAIQFYGKTNTGDESYVKGFKVECSINRWGIDSKVILDPVNQP